MRSGSESTHVSSEKTLVGSPSPITAKMLSSPIKLSFPVSAPAQPDVEAMTPAQKRALIHARAHEPRITIKTTSPDASMYNASPAFSKADMEYSTLSSISRKMLAAFSKVAERTLLPNDRNQIWYLPQTNSKALSVLVHWMMDYCRSSRTPVVPVGDLSLQDWMSVYKAAHTVLDIPIAAKQLRKQLPGEVMQCGFDETVEAYGIAKSFGNTSPEWMFRKRLQAFAWNDLKDEGYPDLSLYNVETLWKRYPEESFTAAAVNKTARTLYYGGWTAEHELIFEGLDKGLQYAIEGWWEHLEERWDRIEKEKAAGAGAGPRQGGPPSRTNNDGTSVQPKKAEGNADKTYAVS